MKNVADKKAPFRLTLAAARTNAGLTQAEAAQKLGITPKTLCYYETGQRVPRWNVVQSMSVLYAIPIDFLRLN